MVRWSPSATNKQPWRIVVDGKNVHFFEHKTRGYARESTGDIQKVDLGIAACHFEIAARGSGIEGTFRKCDPGIPAPDGADYITTYAMEASPLEG
ncbi:nitroreductase family protein [Olsenella sp. AGMB03486]|uniref:nitroreductase family protein n=1 Tax=Olsenella sp. AGMB03486 TaxID=3230364 RepID=UPI0034A029B6